MNRRRLFLGAAAARDRRPQSAICTEAAERAARDLDLAAGPTTSILARRRGCCGRGRTCGPRQRLAVRRLEVGQQLRADQLGRILVRRPPWPRRWPMRPSRTTPSPHGAIWMITLLSPGLIQRPSIDWAGAAWAASSKAMDCEHGDHPVVAQPNGNRGSWAGIARCAGGPSAALAGEGHRPAAVAAAGDVGQRILAQMAQHVGVVLEPDGDDVDHRFVMLDHAVDDHQPRAHDDAALRREAVGPDDEVGDPRLVLQRDEAHALGAARALADEDQARRG